MLSRVTTRVLLVTAVLLAILVGWLELQHSLRREDATSTAADHETDGTVTVVLRNLRYQPDEVRIRPGTRVVFTNEDEVAHNVVHSASQRVGAAPAAFESPVLNPGDSWSFVFSEPGEYSFLCTVSGHQLMGMVGKIIVQDE